MPEFDSEQFFVENKVKEVVADVTEKIESFTETFGPGYFSSTDESVTIQPEQEPIKDRASKLKLDLNPIQNNNKILPCSSFSLEKWRDLSEDDPLWLVSKCNPK